MTSAANTWFNAPPPLPFWTGLGVGVGLSLILWRIPTGQPDSKWVKDDQENPSDDEWETQSEEEEEEEDDEKVDLLTDDKDTIISAKGPMKMTLVVRNDLKMGKGKAAAQCSHAAVAAYKLAKHKAPALLRSWERHGQPKVVLKVDSQLELETVQATARSLGLINAIIADAGRTQIEAGSRTVVAVGPGPEVLIDRVTGHLKLY